MADPWNSFFGYLIPNWEPANVTEVRSTDLNFSNRSADTRICSTRACTRELIDVAVLALYRPDIGGFRLERINVHHPPEDLRIKSPAGRITG
jgi:hypothetical protein